MQMFALRIFKQDLAKSGPLLSTNHMDGQRLSLGPTVQTQADLPRVGYLLKI